MDVNLQNLSLFIQNSQNTLKSKPEATGKEKHPETTQEKKSDHS